VSRFGCYYSGNLANVLHCILEEHQVHDGVGIVVFSKGFSKSQSELFCILELIIEFIIKTTNELGENEWLSVGTEVLLKVELRELF
jgi:hypothetical protein